MNDPLHADTLVEMLIRRAEASPDGVAFRWDEADFTYRRLLESVRMFARRLESAGVGPGHRVVLALPNGSEFFVAFYGILFLGAVAVPVFPGPDAARWGSFVRMCDAGHLIVRPDLGPEDASAVRREAERQRFRCLTVTSDSGAGSAPLRDVEPSSVALIQFTSGSTSDPKGVQLTHAALMTNVRQMVEGMEITGADTFVSWLPVYHDMGLVLKTMAPFAVGAPLILLPTSLHRPARWLEAIAAYGATFTAAPDSAYRLAMLAAKDPEAVDLSSLRVALNAAEPVRAGTISTFEQRFGLENVMVAGYGLAEATVGVSMMPPGSPVRTDAAGHVSVGRPFPGVDVFVGGEAGATPSERVSELLVRTPAATVGYVNNETATTGLFDERGAIRTGDLGAVDGDGFVYVLGRSKDVIIQTGRSLYAADVEELAEEEGWSRRAAAVGIEPREGMGEQLYLFVETNTHAVDEQTAEHRSADLVDRINRRFGLRPGRVYLVRPKTIPLTSNGKKKRQELQARYLDRTLLNEGRILHPHY